MKAELWILCIWMLHCTFFFQWEHSLDASKEFGRYIFIQKFNFLRETICICICTCRMRWRSCIFLKIIRINFTFYERHSVWISNSVLLTYPVCVLRIVKVSMKMMWQTIAWTHDHWFLSILDVIICFSPIILFEKNWVEYEQKFKLFKWVDFVHTHSFLYFSRAIDTEFYA